MSRATELEKALTTLFRKGTEVGYTETEIDEFLENIDYRALLQAVWNKAETVYAYRADGKNALSLDYRSSELFKQRATLLYSIVENPKRHGKSYNKWLGDKKKPSHRERICVAIDDALAQKPDNFEALLELLRQAGYEVKGKKVPSLLGDKQKKSIRMDTLGDGYTPADLRAVIAGEKAHTPQKNAAAPVKPEKRSGNLLVDIQAKLRAGKGAGYARWATLFNLKQMAQTVAYLQDHELLDYAVLSEKAAAASAHFNELSARIKAAETRMAEIAVLREHIVNYAKSRDTYVAYRKAGYSKKFLAEHESEITIHKAAKNYFDGLGFKKLPTIKALNTEYAELLAEKKSVYTDYRKAREEMKELLTAKANIDRILELDKEQEEANERREKEAEQR